MIINHAGELINQPMYIEQVTTYIIYHFVYIDENDELRDEVGLSTTYPIKKMITLTIMEGRIDIEGISRERLPDQFEDTIISGDSEIKANFYFESFYTKNGYYHNKYKGYVIK